MKKAILGKKLGMTQVYTEDGIAIPVTVVEAGPCMVTQVKTDAADGYGAVQVGFDDIRESLVNKPLKGQFAKAGVGMKRYLREFRFDDVASYAVGDEIKADIFAAGDMVDVAGVSKGKGFAGAIKRWNQHRGPMKHGSHYHRAPGSMGSSASPSRVFKSKNLPGHMGNDNVTVQNLTIVKVDVESNLLLIRGAVPGIRGSLVTIRDTVKQ